MPLFEMQCPVGHITEVMRSVDERDNLFTCHCGRETRRKISRFSFSFGWTLSEKSYEEGQPMDLVKNV